MTKIIIKTASIFVNNIILVATKYFPFIFKVGDAVESLSREILTIQARGDKEAAKLLLQKYSVMSQPLEVALRNLERVQVNANNDP